MWVLLLLWCLGAAVADIPANCSYEDTIGAWTFYEGERGEGRYHDCSGATLDDLKHVRRIKLQFPNFASDLKTGESGTWTLIYNQGFEVTIGFRQYFAFSNYANNNGTIISYCHETMPGWSSDKFSRDWACYMGRKDGDKVEKRTVFTTRPRLTKRYENDPDYIDRINKAQSSWTAGIYEEYEGMTVEDLVNRAGGHQSTLRFPQKFSTPPRLSTGLNFEYLPESFDWRNVNGQNFVSPVRNQGHCGSCFAFSSLGMLEARARIMTNNSFAPVFSPQEVIDCSMLQQGCDGGFPYLIGGKYAKDYGVVEESCNPYAGVQGKGKNCIAVTYSCRRFYVGEYNYVGDFFGGCNENLMRQALVERGPLVVGYMVYPDFMHYKSGVYHHTGLHDHKNFGFNPYEAMNHAVLVVGYGTEGGVPYWLVKNSWSEKWGLDGYFKIRRGNDECGFESLAFEATPIPTY